MKTQYEMEEINIHNLAEVPSKTAKWKHSRSFPCVGRVRGFNKNGFHISQCHYEMLPVCALAIVALPVLLQYGHWDWLGTVWFYLLSPEVQQLDVIWLRGGGEKKQEHMQIVQRKMYISINMMYNCTQWLPQTNWEAPIQYICNTNTPRHSIMEYTTIPEVPLDIPSNLPSSTWECNSIKGHFPIQTLPTII